MPKRETRHDIERALAEHRRKRRALPPALEQRVIADVDREMAKQRKTLGLDEFVEIHVRFSRGMHKLIIKKGRKRRRPGESGIPALVEPPRGPLPLQGGAEAPLEFDN